MEGIRASFARKMRALGVLDALLPGGRSGGARRGARGAHRCRRARVREPWESGPTGPGSFDSFVKVFYEGPQRNRNHNRRLRRDLAWGRVSG
ncbi:hypothetical protein GCM10010431_83550 [Streptomyces kunmingensis]